MTGEPAAPGPTDAGGLRLTSLGVRYHGRREPALHDVTLEVVPGSLVGVAGRTGAGKSTLALAAAGFLPRVVRARVDGYVELDGIDVVTAGAAELLGRVGIVFATPANQLSASKLTVREELAFGLENLGLERAAMDARIDDVLARLGIAHLARREPFALSGGEQQRVAIASIVAMGTRVLVLDEPTAQLDPAGTAQVADLLAQLAGTGSTVLCAEHDPAVLARAGRVVVLDGGRAVALGPPGQALSTRVLEPLGLAPPTHVALAEAAGLSPERAFDEAAIVAALRALAGPPGASRSLARAIARPAADPFTAGAVSAVPVTVEGLGHRYPGGIEALGGVDLSIEPGTAVAIVGQNGSGKTTFVRHLNGLLRPTAGRVLVAGQDIATTPVHRLARTIGFVFQNPDDQLFERSVEREVDFGPRNLGLAPDDRDRLVAAALQATGLGEDRTSNPYDLDLSRRKLVALASVLATEPAVVVLDEPTTGQDGPGIGRVGAIVDGLRAAGRTVIAITHDMEFAARHFERIVVMRAGSVVADGPPAEVFAPASADLLASTGLAAPPAARIGAALGLSPVPLDAATLLAAVARRGRPGSAPARRPEDAQ